MNYSFEQLDKLERTIGTPCYLVNEDKFVSNIRNIKNAFISRYSNSIIGYSFKTNYVPYICQLAKNEECYAEVVSFLEYQIALRIGYAPKQIIYNGPIKREDEFFFALDQGSLINIDSFYEIAYLEKYRENNPTKKISVGIRVNIRIKDEDGNSAIYGQEDVGRFGFARNEISEVVDRLNKIECDIVSLHGHTSSKNRAIYNYIQISNELLNVRRDFDLNPKCIDLGGGFFGPVPKGMFSKVPPTFDEYATSIVENLLEDSWFSENRPFLVIEPGMSVAASSMSYITRIFDIKKRPNRIIAQVDGNMFHIRQNLYQFHLPYEIVTKSKVPGENTDCIIDFTGSTCMESDILVRKEGGVDFCVGDFLKIDNVGAYTFVMGSNFIQFMPHVAVFKNDSFFRLRNGNDFENFISVFNWCYER